MSFVRVAKGIKIVMTDSSPASYRKTSQKAPCDPVALSAWANEVLNLADEYQRELGKRSRGGKERANELKARWQAMELARIRGEARRLGILL